MNTGLEKNNNVVSDFSNLHSISISAGKQKTFIGSRNNLWRICTAAMLHLGRVFGVDRNAVDSVRVSGEGRPCHVFHFLGGTTLPVSLALALALAHAVVIVIVVVPDLQYI